MRHGAQSQDGKLIWDHSDPADRFDVADAIRRISCDFELDFDPLPDDKTLGIDEDLKPPTGRGG